MTTFIDRGFALLNRAMKPAAALSVRYFRGATVISDALEATLSNQQIEQVASAGTAIIGRQFTWRLKRDGLVIDGEPITPQKFDRIEWGLNGTVFVFVVMPELAAPESNTIDPRSDWVPASVKLTETR